jgi:CheY-like chemotaxis protein
MAIILVVEDDIFILKSLEWVLEDMGHSALAASDLAEALAYLVAVQPIDALFVDIRLNALSFGGYEVADQAIELRPHLPVLYTSGRPLSGEMTERFVPGGRFLRKPYSPAQIEAFLTQALH